MSRQVGDIENDLGYAKDQADDLEIQAGEYRQQIAELEVELEEAFNNEEH